MITSGITRKIDELGRIVLPKEIRKTLNINTGDDFQIFLEEDKIILQRYQRLKNIEKELIKIINLFKEELGYKIYLVINNHEIITNQHLVKDINNIVIERKIYIQDQITKNQLFENIIDEGRLVILPIIKNSDLLGTIIVISKEKIEEIIKMSKIINNLIKLTLEN